MLGPCLDIDKIRGVYYFHLKSQERLHVTSLSLSLSLSPSPSPSTALSLQLRKAIEGSVTVKGTKVRPPLASFRDSGTRKPNYIQQVQTCAFEYSLRTDSDLGSDATPTLQAFYYFARSLEENMDATRKAVVAVALAEDQAIQYK